jgi:uncharacterized protein (TIGR03437 family)
LQGALGGYSDAFIYKFNNVSVTTVSAASFKGPAVAAASIVAAFGMDLSATSRAAAALPLPTGLDGMQVMIRDSAGAERLAPLFFVSPTQVNYQIPEGTSPGAAIVMINGEDGTSHTGTAQITAVAPGLFTANGTGRGAAVGLILRLRPDGSQTFESVVEFDAAQKQFGCRPIDLRAEDEQVALVLFGTGFRFCSSLDAVSVKLGGVEAEVLYVGPQPDFAGLDQLNVRLPRSLEGRGEVEVAVTIDGQAANIVRLKIR